MSEPPRPVTDAGRDSGPRASGAGESLESLVAGVVSGDERAFAGLYDVLAPSVFGIARRVVRNPALAEEVTQEVFVELWRSASRHDAARGSVRTWALTIAHRRAVDRVRSEQSAFDRDARAGALAAASPEYDEVSEAVTDRLEREQVRRCLEGLTPLQEESVRLAYWSGYTYREVAGRLGAPLGTVKARIRDGLLRLRDCLGATA
jgi:RNA polymerase sigma-70 factor, ECF subfamily